MDDNNKDNRTDHKQALAKRLIAENYDHLLRYASFKLSDHNFAVDLVHDTFVAAFQQSGSFKNKSTERTWLTAILKHKIFRHSHRTEKFTCQDPQMLAHLWQARSPHLTIGTFDQPFINKEFMRSLCDGVHKLSEPARSVFILKYVHNEGSAEICNRLSLSNANFWVICHRSRSFIKNYLISCGYSFG